MIPIIHLTECPSTNDKIIDFLEDTAENKAVYTFCQTKGRGQYGNRWESASNQNLAYSLAVEASQIALPENILNYHTAILARDFIAKLTENNVKIKWPNDLILHQKKICGMLIEKRKVKGKWFYIIGIGVNVLQSDFQFLPKAGSIFTQTGKVLDLQDFAQQFHQYISGKITKFGNENEVLSQFNEHLFRRNAVSVFEYQKKRQNGIIRRADEDGFLWVELEEIGLQKFYHKEIEMLY